jgi:hypothetical protein
MDKGQAEHPEEQLQTQQLWKWDFIPLSPTQIFTNDSITRRIQIHIYVHVSVSNDLIVSHSPQEHLSTFQAHYELYPVRIGPPQ